MTSQFNVPEDASLPRLPPGPDDSLVRRRGLELPWPATVVLVAILVGGATWVTAISSDVSKNNDKTNDLRQQIQSTNTTLADQIKSADTKLTQRVDRLDVKVDAIKDGVNELKVSIGKIDAKLDGK